MARMYMEGGKPKKSAVVPSSKRTGDTTSKKVTVSQATIDKIKSQGMTAAIKAAAAGGASASYVEGVKRMYGAGRLAKATSSRINEAQKPKTYRAGNMPAYRPATAGTTKFSASRAASASLQGKSAKASMEAGKTAPKPKAKPAAKKKTGTTDPFARFVFGVGRAAAEPFKSKNK